MTENNELPCNNEEANSGTTSDGKKSNKKLVPKSLKEYLKFYSIMLASLAKTNFIPKEKAQQSGKNSSDRQL
jgi:hypothetical protein